jgi:tetratricopeptide (TPR) repeat protein
MAFGGESAESYYDEGLTASMKGDLAQAIQFFEKAVRLDRSFLAARHQLGKAYARVGRSDQAVAYLREVVERKPANVAARIDLGTAYLAAGRIQEARTQFNEVIDLDEADPRGYIGLAETFFDEGNWNAAVMQAQQAIERGGETFQALFLLGRAARLAGDPALATVSKESLDAAEKLLEQSIEISPDNPEAYYFRGEVCFARSQYSVALDNYRAAESRADPGRAYAAFGDSFSYADILSKQALCHQRLGQDDRARELAERILAINPAHRLARAIRGED